MCFLKVSVLTVVLAGCSTANVPAADSTQPATQRNPVETALLEAAGVQYGAYAELLGMLSGEGATPLLSREVDLGAAAPELALANYLRLIELTDRMVAAEAEFQEAIKVLSEQTGLPAPGKTAAPNSVGWNLQLLSLMPVMQTGLLQTDLLHSGWKFWKWGENSRRRARATVLGVVFADAKKHQLQKPEQEMMRRRVYDVARTRYADRGDIGRSEREFFENLRDGKLDHIAQRLHADMSHDASDAGMSYLTITGVQGKRPIDVVYEEGCRGLAAGVDLYVAAGKAAVAGGLGPEAGEKFLEGYDKAVEIVEKIQEIESKAGELRDAVRDPIGYARDKVPEMLKDRAVELLKEKTGLSDEVIEECTDQLGEAVQQVVQNVEVSRRIDAAYQREQFKAELAEAKNVQPLSSEEQSAVDRPRITVDGPRLRRITEQVHEEMAAEGWRLSAVEIDFRAAAGEARSSFDSLVAWWIDACAGATRLTILASPVVPGTALALPGGVRVELIEVADSGAIRRLTERPVAVLNEGMTRVAVQPQAVVARPEGPAVPGDELPTVRPEPPPRVGKWPNPEVFLALRIHELRVSGDRSVFTPSPPGPFPHKVPRRGDPHTEPPEWQGKNALYQRVFRNGGLPIFHTAFIYIRPLQADEVGSMVKVGSGFRFRGTEWGPMKSLSPDQSILFTLRGGFGIAVVSAGGYVAVVHEMDSKENSDLLRNMRLEFLRTIRDRLQRAGGQD